MTSPNYTRTDGPLTAQITNAVVGVFRDYTGRGPTKARTFLNDELVQVLLEDTMTTAERQLAQGGEREFVLQLRRKFQEAMRGDLVQAVEQLGGRKVIAFMSDNTVEPDMALESFVVEKETVGASSAGQRDVTSASHAQLPRDD
jgi:uncharacterized protein YbcI